MKRGLKSFSSVALTTTMVVKEGSPMKRGLKY